MIRVRFRPRRVLGPFVWAISALTLGFLLYFSTNLISRSLKSDDPWQRYLNNNLVAGAISGAVFYLIGLVISLPRKVTLFAPVVGDDREVLSRPELTRQFDTDASCSNLKEWGWELRGNGTESHSNVIYKSPISDDVTVTAQFKAICNRPEKKYWRTGILFFGTDGCEKICVHIDNHNLLVGYLDQKLVLRIAVPFSLQGRFTTISCQISHTPVNGILRAFCQINGATYLLGDVSAAGWPWKLQLRAWSDGQKNHHISVRDISISKVLA